MKHIIAIYLVLISCCSTLHAEEMIKMTFEQGVYTLPCEVNGLNMRFIFDTGASSVSISMAEALFMLKNGYLDDQDITGITKTQIANGQIDENVVINLKYVKIGERTIKNVQAVVSNSLDAPLLLGQTVIRQLGSWSIEGDYLVIKSSGNAFSNTKKGDGGHSNYFIIGNEYYENNDYSLAFDILSRGAE